MNKCSNILIILLPLLLMATGCSDNNEPLTEEKGMPVMFSMMFASMATTTRSTLDNVWPNSTTIAVSNGLATYQYVTPDNSGSASSGATVMLSPSGESVLNWPSVNPNWNFTAWYPYNWDPTASITVANDQSTTAITDEAVFWAYDKIYAPPVSGYFQNTVPLTFYHQMSRVVVVVNTANTTLQDVVASVTFGEGSKDVDVTGTITKLGETGGTVTDATKKTTWSTTAATNSYITMRKTSTATEEASHIYTFECMLPPQSGGAANADLLTIYTTTSGDPSSRKYVYQDTYSLEAGYQYNYFITCKESGVIMVSTLTISGWNPTVTVTNTAYVPDKCY